MKKFRQLVSLTLSALMTFSCFSGLTAVGVSAAGDDSGVSSSVDLAGNSDFFPSTSKEVAVGASDGLNITAESNLFPDSFKAVSKTELSGNNDLVTVSYYINTSKRLLDFDLELSFDPQKLEFTEDYNFDEDYNQKIMPQVSGDIVINDSTAGKIKCNFSSTQAKTKLTDNGELVPFLTVTFKAIGSGDTTVSLNVKDFRICDVKNRVADPDTIEWVVRESAVQTTQTPVSCASAAYAGTYTSYSEPAEPVTQKQTEKQTEATSTTPQVAAEGVYVNATSNLFPGQAKSFSDSDIIPSGGYVTVTYFANCSKRLLDVDFELEYTDSILEFSEAYNFTEDGDQKIMPQLSGDAVVNTNTPGRVLFNFSSTQAKTKLTDNGNAVPFVTVVFRVRESGNADVNLNIKDLRICDVKNRVADPDTIEWVVREGKTQSIQTEFYTSTTIAPGVGSEIPESQTTIPNPVTQPTTATTPPVIADGLYINATSNLFQGTSKSISQQDLLANNNYVTVTYFVNCEKRLLDFDFDIEFDPAVLQFAEEYNFNEDYDQQFMPQVAGDIVINDSTAGKVKCNFSSTQAKTKLTDNGSAVPFVRMTFKVLKQGNTTVNLNVKDLRICDVKNRVADPDTIEWVVREGNVQSTQTAFGTSATIAPGVASGEPVTTPDDTTSPKVTTKPIVETDPAPDGMYIKATSNLFPETTKTVSQQELIANSNYVTVTYFVNCEKRLLDFDFELEFDPTVLQFTEEYNYNEDYDQQFMPQVSGDVVINDATAGKVKCNFASTQAKTKLTDNGNEVPFVRATFKVLKEGNTTVNLKVKDFRICDLKNRVADPDTIEWIVRESVYQSEHPTAFGTNTVISLGGATEEPVTVPVETTETTKATDPIIDDGTIYVVAGKANMLGCNWDGSVDTGNDMQRQGNVYVRTFPNVDCVGEEIQIKIVANKDGEQTWIGDELGQNICFKVTKVTDVTVTFDPATNAITVSGDGVEMIIDLPIESMRIAGAADDAKGEWLHGISWAPAADENLMEKIADGVYQIRFNDLPEEMGYEFKVAANGSWDANWGFDSDNVQFEFNKPLPAQYNGGNFVFDLDEDSDIIITIDLRNFVYKTKEGATITIATTDEPIPTTKPVETTTAKVTTQPTTAKVTTQPTTAKVTTQPTTAKVTTQPTTAKVTTQPTTAKATTQPVPTTKPVATSVPVGDGLNITADSNLFPKQTKSFSKAELTANNNYVTVTYFVNCDKRLLDFDFELEFDPTVLQFTEEYNYNEDYDQQFLPQVSGDVVINDSTPGKLKCNFASTQAKTKLTNNGEEVPFVKVTFKVLSMGKTTTVDLKVKDFRICDVKNRVADPETIEWIVRESVYQSDHQTPFGTRTLITAGTESVEPTTVIVTTQPTTAKVTTQPTTAKVTTQPTTAKVTTQPTTAKVTTQPTTVQETTVPPITNDKLYFEVPVEFWGQPRWNSKHTKAAVYCHVESIYNDDDYQVQPFASMSERCEHVYGNIFSYDPGVNGTIKNNADYTLVLAIENADGYIKRTCEVTFNKDCYGDTLKVTDEKRMNLEIQQYSDYLANWQKPANSSKYGPLNIINQLGEFTGGALPVNMPKEKLITSNLYEYAFKMNANSKFFTTEDLNAMEEALGVTAQSVYDSYAAEYADVITAKTASGELKDTYNTINGSPVFYVPTLERVAERLGLQITPPTPDDTKIYFAIPDEWGEVKWNSKHTKAAVYCHMYRVYNGPELNSFTFATASERCEWEHDNIFSFDTTVYGDIVPGADYVVILAADNVSGVRHQTCDITMSFDCLGDTLTPTNETRTNSMDSQKQDYLAVWSKPANAEKFGAMNLIDSLGNLLGGKFPYYMPRAKLIADRLYDPAFKMKSNAKYFTTQRLNELEAELGVTARQVYDQYVITYKDLIDEKVADGTLVDKYDSEGNAEYLVPTLERVAERLGITV